MIYPWRLQGWYPSPPNSTPNMSRLQDVKFKQGFLYIHFIYTYIYIYISLLQITKTGGFITMFKPYLFKTQPTHWTWQFVEALLAGYLQEGLQVVLQTGRRFPTVGRYPPIKRLQKPYEVNKKRQSSLKKRWITGQIIDKYFTNLDFF